MELLEKLEALYATTQTKHPARRSGTTRSWELKSRVWLNLEWGAEALREKSAASKVHETTIFKSPAKGKMPVTREAGWLKTTSGGKMWRHEVRRGVGGCS